MDYKYIEQLLARYFAAETTEAEESILRAFFSQRGVPSHLAHYAPLFSYQADEREEGLGIDFDRRVLERLEARGDAPQLRVKMRKMTLAARLRPLQRAAAAVAIVALLGLSAHEAWEQSPIVPVVGAGAAQLGVPTADTTRFTPQRQMEESMKMAVTGDTLRGGDEALIPDVPITPR